MTINRAGNTPQYYEYGTKYVIMPDKSSTSEDLPEPVSITGPHLVYIPPYQRKLVWKDEDVSKLIHTKSLLYGNVILAVQPTGRDLPMTLVDGLQRLGVVTAFLYHMYPLVLSSTPKDQINADLFKKLSINTEKFQPVYEHNHKLLLKHPRVGIRESYKELSDSIESYIVEQLKENPKEFSKNLLSAFMNRFIAIDPYFGFQSDKELTETFLNINSTGVILSHVDLLRSDILSQAYLLKWLEEDTLEIENKFTEVFQPQRGGNKCGMKVLGENLYNAIQDSSKKNLFKTWNELDKQEIEDFLEYLENAINAGDEKLPDKTPAWKELSEIYRCGDLPFAITVWYFYLNYFKQDKKPDFVGGKEDTTDDCRFLLRAFYRRLIDGTIGQITGVLQDLIKKQISSIKDLAELINPENKAGSLNKDPLDLWLFQSLRTIDPTKAKRIFNACLLPNRNDKGDFSPKTFRNSVIGWNIDHLIPKKHKEKNKEGEKQINQLVNLAPLPYDLNHLAKTTPCETKLKPEGLYSAAAANHPYLNWLINDHYITYSKNNKITTPQGDINVLNAQICLTAKSDPPIGDDRIKKLAEILKQKL